MAGERKRLEDELEKKRAEVLQREVEVERARSEYEWEWESIPIRILARGDQL